MDIRNATNGTLFRLFGDTFIVTKEYYYCPHHGIHKIVTHNLNKGEVAEIGEVALYEAEELSKTEILDYVTK